MRPSKLRFPDRTATTVSFSASTTLATSSGSGPEFPMHVVHPYPTRLKPSFSRYGVSRARSRDRVPAGEPGASDVLPQGRDPSPASTARLARRPAATITDGLDVFVQDVMA